MTGLYPDRALDVKKRGGGVRTIPAGKWWINRNTPVGEDAEIWERMPHEGRRLIEWRDVLGQPRSTLSKATGSTPDTEGEEGNGSSRSHPSADAGPNSPRSHQSQHFDGGR